MNAIYEKNLAALQQTDAALAGKIANLSLEDFPAEAFQTKSGLPSVRLHVPGANRPHQLHSAYDPQREAQRWVDAIDFSEQRNTIVFGIALGYHVLRMVQQHHDDIRFLFIVEREPRIFKLALLTCDLTPVIQRQGVQWLIGQSPQELPESIGEKRTDIILHNCRFAQVESSVRLDPAYYETAREEIINSISYDEINIRTNFENQGRNQFNIFMNLPAMIRGYRICDLAGQFANYPAVVVAAGPSLDKNVDLLRDVQDRAVVISVDTTQTTLQKRGITPDAVVTGDPTPLNLNHFEKINSLGESFLAFHPECYRQITQKYLQHPYLLPLFDTHSALLEHLFELESHYGYCDRAMNVGHIALNLANHLGCSPLILIGFDFAFSKEGGKTHTAEAVLSRSTSKMEADGTIDIGAKEGKAPEESGKMMLVPGYYGDMVPTTAPFKQYILSIAKTIAAIESPVIDATEGGARFEGAAQMPFQEAIQQYLTQPGVRQRWQAIKQNHRPAQPAIISGRLQEGYDLLSRSRQQFYEMSQQVSRWPDLWRGGQLTWQQAKQEWNVFNEKWIAVVSEPLFDMFLGTAVQYIYFRRQRQTRPAGDSAEDFLRCVYEKYDSILQEMLGLLDHFIQVIDLSLTIIDTLDRKSKMQP